MRITIGLNKRTERELDKIAEVTGLSKTEIVNRAISAYYTIENVRQHNWDLLIRRNQDKNTEVYEKVTFL